MNIFELEINRSLEELEEQDKIMFERIKDDRYNVRKSKFDFWAITCNGKFYGIEAKSTKQKSLPFANIRQHQVDTLRKLDTKFENSSGIFVVCFRWGRTIICYAVSAKRVHRYMKTAKRRSFPIDFFTEYGIEIPTYRDDNKKIMWDFSGMLGLKETPTKVK